MGWCRKGRSHEIEEELFFNTLGEIEYAWAGWCRQGRGDGLRDLTLWGFLPLGYLVRLE